jgi:hypothetical protein
MGKTPADILAHARAWSNSAVNVLNVTVQDPRAQGFNSVTLVSNTHPHIPGKPGAAENGRAFVVVGEYQTEGPDDSQVTVVPGFGPMEVLQLGETNPADLLNEGLEQLSGPEEDGTGMVHTAVSEYSLERDDVTEPSVEGVAELTILTTAQRPHAAAYLAGWADMELRPGLREIPYGVHHHRAD